MTKNIFCIGVMVVIMVVIGAEIAVAIVDIVAGMIAYIVVLYNTTHRPQ